MPLSHAPSTGGIREEGGIAQYLLLIALVAAAYFIAARMGQALALSTKHAPALWPPTGIALAALLTLGQRVWPGVFLAAFSVNVLAGKPLWVACAIALGNTCNGVIGAGVLRRAGFHNALARTWDVVSLLAVAIGSSVVSASVGTASLALGGMLPWSQYPSLWWLWWTGDSLGVLILAPVLLTWVDCPRLHWKGARLAEFSLYLAATVLIGLIVFIPPAGASPSFYPRAYVTFPLLAWAGLRLQSREVALGFAIVCVLAIWGAVHDHGPFGHGPPDDRLVLMDPFIATVGCTALLIAAVSAERQGAREAARASEGRLRRAYEELEERVRERTAELAAAVAELEHHNQEKETLLREIHHRVKNNLQVVCSLLNLQADGHPAELVEFAETCKARVRSMALVHEHLYQSQNLQSVPVGVYLGALLEELACAQPVAGRVAYEVKVQDIVLPVDQAIPCGLIVNELVTNALKHAFPAGRRGSITVSLAETSADQLELIVGDDGAGMAEQAELHRSDGFGLTLVSMLADQLQAALRITRHPGTRVELSFARRRGV
jgi:two-component sensor histidine kinase/integral membrane sensor domain MASE1